MRLIIDGYNLLKWVIHNQQASQAQRDQFIILLKRYARVKRNKVLLVFDGGPVGWPSQEEMSPYLVCVYTGPTLSADTYIEEYLQQHKQRPIVVISSDRHLKHTSKQCGAETLDVKEFWAIITGMFAQDTQKLQPIGKVHKISTTDNPELDLLMQTVVPIIKKEDAEKLKMRAARKLSKWERAKAHTIKKL